MADRTLQMFASGMLLLLLGVEGVAAQPSNDRTTSSGSATSGTGADNPARTTEANPADETEAVALRLVKTHLPELKGLLDRLRTGEPRQYQRAVNDLARSARKLELIRKRDEQLFEIEVELLKAQNAVSLLIAKLKVRDHEADRKRLREAVARLQQTQIERAEYDVKTLRARLQRAEQQLLSAEQRWTAKQDGLGENVDKAYTAALRRAGRQAESASAPSTSSSRAAAEKSQVTPEKTPPTAKNTPPRKRTSK